MATEKELLELIKAISRECEQLHKELQEYKMGEKKADKEEAGNDTRRSEKGI